MILKQITDGFLSLIFPRRCPYCDKPVKPYGKMICDNCIPKFRYIHGIKCYKCGKMLEDENQEYCADCKRKKHYYSKGFAVFDYSSAADSIYRFKYKGRQEYADYYCNQIALLYGEVLKRLHAEAIVPVPIHKSKYKARGFNQAELLAKGVSDITGIPMNKDLIIREKKTKPLKDLTPEERNNNVKGAFKLVRNDVKLESIVIIDDIYTTGATIDAISQLFRAAGVKNIYAVTLAIGKGI